MVEIRPNIAFAILVVSQFIKNPGYQYTKAVKLFYNISKAQKSEKLLKIIRKSY